MKTTSSILLIYHYPSFDDASTIMEHIDAFGKYSDFNIIKVNTDLGFPKYLNSVEFSAIILHYSLFGTFPFKLNNNFSSYLFRKNKCIKIAFFQDEMHFCQQRFDFINKANIKVIYSLLEEEYFNEVYKMNSYAKDVRKTLTGYVCDGLIEKGLKYQIPFKDRKIDVGYRARKLDFKYGSGALEKYEIAEKFEQEAKNKLLTIDISTREQDRIYGVNWYKFTANCKFMLGVMAGTSIFDITGQIHKEVDLFLIKNPNASFNEVRLAILDDYENKIRYRTISPRLFECAAMKTCMILYKDDYQGILKEGIHYIGLEKDFSNINTVFSQMSDFTFVNEIIENAYRDLILSGDYHYKKFVKNFDETLLSLGLKPESEKHETELVNNLIQRDVWIRLSLRRIKSLKSIPFPGRSLLKYIIVKLIRGLKN
jgi:hypothetical protein